MLAAILTRRHQGGGLPAAVAPTAPRILIAALVLLTILAILAALVGARVFDRVMNPGIQATSKGDATMTLVIDAGHGGPDSGAVSKDGTAEKHINLAISQALKAEAEAYGVQVIMTRETEEGLSEEGASWSKVADIRLRRQIMDAAKPDLAISIHLNSFISDSDVCGAQVFYPREATEELTVRNKALAEAIQAGLNAQVSQGKDRFVLPKSDIYVMKDATYPVILVECGFLSNPEDTARLQTEDLQQQIAEVIMAAVAQEYALEKVQNPQNSKIVDSRAKKCG
jgi:N-acetylmuramoyl-L-alanine amidase